MVAGGWGRAGGSRGRMAKQLFNLGANAVHNKIMQLEMSVIEV